MSTTEAPAQPPASPKAPTTFQVIATAWRVRIAAVVYCRRALPDSWAPVPRTIVGGAS
jgi:hypothetical protein